MLQLLHIENIAVIERADIELDKGLTVLSGETGAGKSIVIDSIGALLGKRVSRDLVRSGAQKGFVSAVFTDLPRALRELLDELALSGDEPDTLYVQRQISADGKSTCRVNMKPASAAVLRQLAPYLIDIHGQNDGQKLLDEAHHIEYLDGYAGCAEILERYRPKYQALVTLRREITALETGEQERLQRIDMLTFHKEEIEQAALKPDEDEALAQRKAYFDHAGKIGAHSSRRVWRSREMTKLRARVSCSIRRQAPSRACAKCRTPSTAWPSRPRKYVCWRQTCATARQVRGTIWTFLRQSARWSSSAWMKSTV
ncbi:MAG: AAA family ATPase [Butyricicoccus sp.]